MNLTISEQARMQGFRVQLSIRGRDTETNAGDTPRVIVQDAPRFPDGETEARQKLPIYTTITGMNGCVEDPRAITLFTETETGRSHRVTAFDETSADRVTWKWNCEAQRI